LSGCRSNIHLHVLAPTTLCRHVRCPVYHLQRCIRHLHVSCMEPRVRRAGKIPAGPPTGLGGLQSCAMKRPRPQGFERVTKICRSPNRVGGLPKLCLEGESPRGKSKCRPATRDWFSDPFLSNPPEKFGWYRKALFEPVTPTERSEPTILGVFTHHFLGFHRKEGLGPETPNPVSHNHRKPQN
jgi:hypothetical protein